MMGPTPGEATRLAELRAQYGPSNRSSFDDTNTLDDEDGYNNDCARDGDEYFDGDAYDDQAYDGQSARDTDGASHGNARYSNGTGASGSGSGSGSGGGSGGGGGGGGGRQSNHGGASSHVEIRWVHGRPVRYIRDATPTLQRLAQLATPRYAMMSS